MTAFDDFDASDPFDPRPDPELGHLLREHLDPGGHEAFVARLTRAVGAETAAGGTSWDVLARWARPGLAAAAVVAALLGGWLWQSELAPRADGRDGTPIALAETEEAPTLLPGELATLGNDAAADAVVGLMLEER